MSATVQTSPIRFHRIAAGFYSSGITRMNDGSEILVQIRREGNLWEGSIDGSHVENRTLFNTTLLGAMKAIRESLTDERVANGVTGDAQ